MKSLLFIAFVILASCNGRVSENRLKETMSGIYELSSVTYKGGNMDTSFKASNQVKIYTDKYYMYGATKPDSTAFFGFGTYLFNDTTATEQSILNSYAFDSSSETKVKISKLDTGYTQTMNAVMMQGHLYDISETYRKMTEAKTSDIDGVWQQESFINITGSDTTNIRNKQFKIYQNGHFMWIHHYPAGTSDSSYKKGYGFGRFSVKNDFVNEMVSNSNYREIIGAPITVNYKLNNNKLLLIFNDGTSVTTETYKRLN